VYSNGSLLGNTPFVLEKPTGSDKIEIELRETGYVETKVQIVALTGESVTVGLKPVRTAAAHRPSRPGAAPASAPTTAPGPGPAKNAGKRPATEVLDPWD
jgi:hypothetical protein